MKQTIRRLGPILLLALSLGMTMTAAGEIPTQGKAAFRPDEAVQKKVKSVEDPDRRTQLPNAGGEGQRMGNERGNGGDAVVLTDGTVRFLDLVREPRAEIIDLDIEGLTGLVNQELSKHRGLRNATFVHAHPDVPVSTIVQAIQGALGRLTFYLIPGPLPEVNDRGVVVLPWNLNGQIVRLALQDRASGQVVVDRRYYSQLPPRDRVAFLMHEALIRLWNEDSNNGELISTEKIANFVHILFNRTSHMPEGMPEKIAARYLCDAGYLVSEREIHTWRKLNGILTIGAPYYPTKNAIVFRQGAKCFTAILRLKGPARGSWDSSKSRRSRTGLYVYDFEEFAENGQVFPAQIGLIHGPSGLEDFYFESYNPEMPMIYGEFYKTFVDLRVTVVGY